MLTQKALGVGCGKKWSKVVQIRVGGHRVEQKGSPKPVTSFKPENGRRIVAQTPKSTSSTSLYVAATITPAVAAEAAKFLVASEGEHVPRKSSSTSGRKGTHQDPRGIQAHCRRTLRHAILHHQFRRQGCSSLSLRRMANDRRETDAPAQLQSHQEEVSGPGELLRPAGGD